MPVCRAELFVSHNGVNVYHSYKCDDVENGPYKFWFTTDPHLGEGTDYEFDVRDLDAWDVEHGPLGHVDDEAIKNVICMAIENGEINARQ